MVAFGHKDLSSEGSDGSPRRKLTNHLPEGTQLAILQNFTSRKTCLEKY